MKNFNNPGLAWSGFKKPDPAIFLWEASDRYTSHLWRQRIRPVVPREDTTDALSVGKFLSAKSCVDCGSHLVHQSLAEKGKHLHHKVRQIQWPCPFVLFHLLYAVASLKVSHTSSDNIPKLVERWLELGEYRLKTDLLASESQRVWSRGSRLKGYRFQTFLVWNRV